MVEGEWDSGEFEVEIFGDVCHLATSGYSMEIYTRMSVERVCGIYVNLDMLRCDRREIIPLLHKEWSDR